jgi:mannose/fructose/N-acetylgalactosamine-specific phosphotransferase system component IID
LVGVRLSISGEMMGQLIFCFVFYICRCFFGGIAELYAQSKAIAQQNVFFELLDETPEKINSVRDLAN